MKFVKRLEALRLLRAFYLAFFHKMPISFECYERYHLGYYSQYSLVHYKQYHLSCIIMAYTSIKKACIPNFEWNTG